MKIPRIETLIIGIFFACVGVWAASKCSSKRAEMADRVRSYADEKAEREDRPIRRDTIVVKPAPVNTAAPAPAAQPAAGAPQTYSTSATPVSTKSPAATAKTQAQSAAKPAQTGNKYATLFVTIDGLKMRKTAGLKGELVAKLELYQPVYFLNEKTEWTQEISLGKEKVSDHWVRVRTKEGKEGWVFGAGVHYYKMKRKGVIE